MKKTVSLILVLALALCCLSGCVVGKTALLLVEDTQAESTKLIWAGFSAAAKKMGMTPVLAGLTEETAIEYTAHQVWEQSVAQEDPDVIAAVGLTELNDAHAFLTDRESPTVIVDPANTSLISDRSRVCGASNADLARMAAEHIIGLELPTSGRIRLLYDHTDTQVEQTFTSLLTAAQYLNLESTPLSGRLSEEPLLNNFSIDTVGTYNASSYDTQAEDVSNLILSLVTTAHLNALTEETATAILCRDYYAIGQAAAQAAADALRGKDPATVAVEPILVTKNGPDKNGVSYWLDLLA